MAGYNLDEKSGILNLFGVKSPTKIIKHGDTIEIKHSSLFQYVGATVMNVNDTSINIKLEEKIEETLFYPEDPVVLNVHESQEFYVISGELASIDELNPLVVNVTVGKIEKMKDLRKNKRYYVSIPANIKILGLQEPAFAIVKNISLGGVKINCKEDVMMEDVVELTVVLDKDNKFSFKGSVVRKNKMDHFYEYGIEINNISEMNRRNLHHYLNEFEFGK